MHLPSVLAVLAMLLSIPPLTAAHGIPEDVKACTREKEDAERLACFDRALVGKDAPGLTGDEPIRSAVTRIVERQDGTLVVTLENGQVWAQKSREHFPLKLGDEVTIRGGAFSSTHLFTDSRRSTQVKRVR
jgi:hypothetical protein